MLLKEKQISGNVIGFDFGLKRIGVAIGQTITFTASALTIVNSYDGVPDWHHISDLFSQWQPTAIVMGLPKRLDGSEQPLTQSARKLGQRLSGRYELPVFYIEEQLSSVEAEIRFKACNKKDKKYIDAHAAQVILENWLQQKEIIS